MRKRVKNRGGFTLVELLVVIAIIGILIAMLLPAVQAAREAARRTQCKNQVRQMALASLLHVDSQGFLPSGGWGTRYVADPTRGYGKNQPGSWYYGVFSYLEQNALRDLGRGTQVGTAAYREAILELIGTPIGTFNCPSRRSVAMGVHDSTYLADELRFVSQARVAKGDYAANSGDAVRHASTGIEWAMSVPRSYALADGANAGWEDTENERLTSGGVNRSYQTGVVYLRSQVKLARIPDGTTNTYLIGEKFLSPSGYDDNTNLTGNARWSDNQSMYAGYEWDNQRVAHNEVYFILQRVSYKGITADDYQPARDAEDDPGGWKNVVAYGSAHSGGFNMAMCDGSVQNVSYDVDRRVHQFRSNRLDGEALGSQQ